MKKVKTKNKKDMKKFRGIHQDTWKPIVAVGISAIMAILISLAFNSCASGVHCDAYGQKEVLQLNNDVANVEHKQEKD